MKKKYYEVEVEVLLLTAQDVFLGESSEIDVDSDPYKPGENEWWN